MVLTILGIMFFSTFMLTLFSSVMTVFTPYRLRPVMEGLAGFGMIVMMLSLAAAVVASIVL